ncbi:hypothetical protein [Chamaesiphon minutus]|nr:hypothetical protein [Chamaesiphon minutus]
MFQRVDGCFYSQANFTISEAHTAAKAVASLQGGQMTATGSTPRMNAEACAPPIGQKK